VRVCASHTVASVLSHEQYISGMRLKGQQEDGTGTRQSQRDAFPSLRYALFSQFTEHTSCGNCTPGCSTPHKACALSPSGLAKRAHFS
ncbi:MAG: hypothetical protein JSW48_12135, partial [Betaproteobacteria bacterium]